MWPIGERDTVKGKEKKSDMRKFIQQKGMKHQTLYPTCKLPS